MGSFEVAFTVTLQERQYFLLVGKVIRGTIGRGMVTAVGQESGRPQTLEIEGIGHVQATGQRGAINLAIRYPNQETLEEWKRAIEPGMELEFDVIEAGQSSAIE